MTNLFVWNKLIFLYIDACKFLGSALTPIEIVEVAFKAHSADFDAHMTSTVFKAMLHFSKSKQSEQSSCQSESSQSERRAAKADSMEIDELQALNKVVFPKRSRKRKRKEKVQEETSYSWAANEFDDEILLLNSSRFCS